MSTAMDSLPNVSQHPVRSELKAEPMEVDQPADCGEFQITAKVETVDEVNNQQANLQDETIAKRREKRVRNPAPASTNEDKDLDTSDEQEEKPAPGPIVWEIPANCTLCHTETEDETLLGPVYTKEDVKVHYHCLLSACNLYQRGSEDSGIQGFTCGSIRQESRRCKQQVCEFCGLKGAFVGCCTKKCKRMFHFPCGIKNGCVTRFYGCYNTLCYEHAERQDIRAIADDDTCPICADDLSGTEVFKCSCCNNLVHMECIRTYAINAGVYVLKCPFCLNKEQFKDEILNYSGVYIPIREPTYEDHDRMVFELNCCFDGCPDPERCEDNDQWRLIKCGMCGSRAAHMDCVAQMPNKRFMCPDCGESDSWFDKYRVTVRMPAWPATGRIYIYKLNSLTQFTKTVALKNLATTVVTKSGRVAKRLSALRERHPSKEEPPSASQSTGNSRGPKWVYVPVNSDDEALDPNSEGVQVLFKLPKAEAEQRPREPRTSEPKKKSYKKQVWSSTSRSKAKKSKTGSDSTKAARSIITSILNKMFGLPSNHPCMLVDDGLEKAKSNLEKLHFDFNRIRKSVLYGPREPMISCLEKYASWEPLSIKESEHQRKSRHSKVETKLKRSASLSEAEKILEIHGPSCRTKILQVFVDERLAAEKHALRPRQEKEEPKPKVSRPKVSRKKHQDSNNNITPLVSLDDTQKSNSSVQKTTSRSSRSHPADMLPAVDLSYQRSRRKSGDSKVLSDQTSSQNSTCGSSASDSDDELLSAMKANRSLKRRQSSADDESSEEPSKKRRRTRERNQDTEVLFEEKKNADMYLYELRNKFTRSRRFASMKAPILLGDNAFYYRSPSFITDSTIQSLISYVSVDQNINSFPSITDLEVPDDCSVRIALETGAHSEAISSIAPSPKVDSPVISSKTPKKRQRSPAALSSGKCNIVNLPESVPALQLNNSVKQTCMSSFFGLFKKKPEQSSVDKENLHQDSSESSSVKSEPASPETGTVLQMPRLEGPFAGCV